MKDIINKILERFLETYPEYDDEEYSIVIYKPRKLITTNNIDKYFLQV